MQGHGDDSSGKRMRLRYAGSCRLCDAELAAGVPGVYERATKTVRCLECGSTPEPPQAPQLQGNRARGGAELGGAPNDLASNDLEAGVAGASARREFERRRTRREDRIRSEHPKLGGLILALSDDPQTTRAWAQGARGEERLGLELDSLAVEGVAMLHDRRVPGTRANIDHIAVTANGLWVIDAKRYTGRPTLKVEGGIIRPRVERLLVGRRDCTTLVDGVLRQVELVTAALTREASPVEVRGALAFVDADWPLVGGAFTTRGIHVVWPKRLAKLLTKSGSLEGRDRIWEVLARRFPPA
jgi:hypothetical protein